MMNWFRNIGIMILLLLAGRMAAQAPVLDSVCAGAERYYRVDGEPGSTYSWILTPPAGPATVLPSDADTLQMNWNYAPGNYVLQAVQHSVDGCDADAVYGQVVVIEAPDVYAGPDEQVCAHSFYSMMDATASYTGSLLWETSGDGNFVDNTVLNAIYEIGPNDMLNGSVILTLTGFALYSGESVCGPDTSSMVLYLVLEIIPEFDPIGPLCINSTPPALPDTSINGITGSWEPPQIMTDEAGTFSFTFTPYPGQCGLDTTIDIIVLPLLTPEFDPIGPLCQYGAAPILPETSPNGVTGSWNPAWINTSTPGVFTFTFTSDPGQCATDISMEVIIIPEIMPEFEPVGPLCVNSQPPVLPDTCLQGIPGTWEPPVVSTDQVGTFFFTFTPVDNIPCVLPVTIAITIVSGIVPEFDPIGPLCQNSVPPVLPDTCLQGIPGTWIPTVISTDTPGTFNFIFTPNDNNQCSVETTIEIEIVTEIIPEFDPIGPLCQNSMPPALADTSLNGITGKWEPPTVNTDVQGTFTFVFTPDDPSQCGIESSMDITVNSEIIPEFDQIGSLCQNSLPPLLSDTSLNGITGTWEPPTVSTNVQGTFNFVFTPDDPSQCGIETSINITVTSEIIPEFDPIGPLCQNSLPPLLSDTSLNGITGTWEPPTVNTDVQGTFNFVFTPDDPSQCGIETSIDITVTSEIIPEFDQIGPLCQNSTPPALPDTCLQGITGTWDPPVINTSVPGSFTFIFTPDEGQCAGQTSMNIEVNEEITPLFDPIGPLSQNSTAPALPDTSLNGITGTWDPAFIDTAVPGTFTYTFTPDEGQCALVTDMEITVLFDYLYAITGAGGHCLTGGIIIPLEVDHFTSVAKFQLMLSYNVDKLLCEGYINPDPRLEDNITGVIDQVAGTIILNWQENVPVTFAGQATVCDLVFTPKEPGQGQLTWYTGPTESYFADLEDLPIPAIFFAEEVEIYEPPMILLAPSKTVCMGDTVYIFSSATGTYPPLTYLWTYPDGYTTDVDPFFEGVTQEEAGDYILLVTDSLGCTDQKAIRLIVSENPVADFHDSDTLTVLPGYILVAGYDYASYLWNTGETTENIEIDTTGWYWVKMESHVGCTGIDSVYIIIDESSSTECLFIPNAFTPNNDGLNDTFKVVAGCPVTSFRMLIFNRWGEQLYETSDINRGWDGKKNGSLCPGDVYVYKILYKINGAPGEKEDKIKLGNVLLLR